MKYLLRFIVSCVQPVKQHFGSRTVQKAPLQSMHIERRNGATHPSYINYHLKSEVSITLRCQLCSTRYTEVRIKNCISAIKIATMKNTNDFCYEGKPSRATTKSTLFAISKDERDTKEDAGKSMKNALYALQYAKKHLSGRSDVKQ